MFNCVKQLFNLKPFWGALGVTTPTRLCGSAPECSHFAHLKLYTWITHPTSPSPQSPAITFSVLWNGPLYKYLIQMESQSVHFCDRSISCSTISLGLITGVVCARLSFSFKIKSGYTQCLPVTCGWHFERLPLLTIKVLWTCINMRPFIQFLWIHTQKWTAAL